MLLSSFRSCQVCRRRSGARHELVHPFREVPPTAHNPNHHQRPAHPGSAPGRRAGTGGGDRGGIELEFVDFRNIVGFRCRGARGGDGGVLLFTRRASKGYVGSGREKGRRGGAGVRGGVLFVCATRAEVRLRARERESWWLQRAARGLQALPAFTAGGGCALCAPACFHKPMEKRARYLSICVTACVHGAAPDE